MKHQTGWAKCPICEGSGEVTTKESDFNISEAVAYNRIRSMCKKPPEQVPEKEYEPCQTCKDQEFKGCLPVHSEVEG